MPSWIVPSDAHVPSDTGHTTDHNHMADDLTLLGQYVGQVKSNAIRTVTAASYTVSTATDYLLLGDTSLNNVTFTLPDATTCTGQCFVFKIVNAANTVFFATTGGQTIDGASPGSWSLGAVSFSGFEIMSNGANWDVVGTFGQADNLAVLGLFASQGSIQTENIQTKSANYTIALTDYIVIGNPASANVTFTLPDATICKGQQFIIGDSNSTFFVVLNTVGGQTVGGLASGAFQLGLAWAVVVLMSDGANWQVIGSNGTFAQLVVNGPSFLAGPIDMLNHAITDTSNFSANAGTASIAPINLTAGTNLTTAAAGAVEFDGTCFYNTAAASSRQVVDAEQFVCLSSAYTLTNTTSAQKLFNATANGALTVQASTAYQFEAEFDLTSLSSSSHTLSFGFGGTAGFTSIKYVVDSNTGAAGTLAAWQNIVVTSASATAFTAAGTTTTAQATLRGIIRISTGGTIIPQITQGTASAAAIVGANSWFRIWPVGSSSVTNVGNWS